MPMTEAVIRDALAADFARIVALNAAEVQQTSPMDSGRLAFLHGISTYHKVAVVDGRVDAFLIAMREGAPYPNENYSWFAAHLPRFLYVDRIVVAAGAAGLGIGGRLYEDLFATARGQGVHTVACEFNVEPPNPASQRFHAKHGFREMETQWVANGSKRVSLQAAQLQGTTHRRK